MPRQHKMQTSANTEVKCICETRSYENQNKNHTQICTVRAAVAATTATKTATATKIEAKTTTATKTAATTTPAPPSAIVCNMAAATIPTTAMTDDESGCCCSSKCGSNIRCCNVATPTKHCCASKEQKLGWQNQTQSLSINLAKTISNTQQQLPTHTAAAAANVADDNHNLMAASESAAKDCKHSTVIRRRSVYDIHHKATAVRAIDAATTTTTKICTTTHIHKMHTSAVGDWLRRMCAVLPVLLFCFAILPDCAQAALNNVNLFIEPPAVRRGQSVILRCQYALEGAPLYSIKYYRGNYEFYRYTPGEFPNVKYFQYPGIRVDEHISNATQVVLRDVNFSLSGNFSCEVTADAPLFSTATAYAQVQVVEFPEKRPQLFTEHARYEPGDILRANCSTPPSRPRADLQFTINNIPVSSEETQYIRTVDNLIASRRSLKVQLHAEHFAAAAINTQHLMNHLGGSSIGVPYYSTHNVGGGAGAGAGVSNSLILRCTAQIGDLYQEYKEIELGTPQKDPVPARVTLSSGSSLRNFFETYFSSSSASSAATNSAASNTMRRSAHNTVEPMKSTILAAVGVAWRSQMISSNVAAAVVSVVVGICNTLRLRQASSIANR